MCACIGLFIFILLWLFPHPMNLYSVWMYGKWLINWNWKYSAPLDSAYWKCLTDDTCGHEGCKELHPGYECDAQWLNIQKSYNYFVKNSVLLFVLVVLGDIVIKKYNSIYTQGLLNW
jgi:hypothetical protein